MKRNQISATSVSSNFQIIERNYINTASVSSNVSLDCSLLKNLVTLAAFVWFYLYVYTQTFYETTINCNTFVTMHLLVRLIPSVCYKMCFKILLCKKVLSHWLYRHISRHLYWMFLYFYLYNVLHRTQQINITLDFYR